MVSQLGQLIAVYDFSSPHISIEDLEELSIGQTQFLQKRKIKKKDSKSKRKKGRDYNPLDPFSDILQRPDIPAGIQTGNISSDFDELLSSGAQSPHIEHLSGGTWRSDGDVGDGKKHKRHRSVDPGAPSSLSQEAVNPFAVVSVPKLDEFIGGPDPFAGKKGSVSPEIVSMAMPSISRPVGLDDPFTSAILSLRKGVELFSEADHAKAGVVPLALEPVIGDDPFATKKVDPFS
jgi:hypothetical protein